MITVLPEVITERDGNDDIHHGTDHQNECEEPFELHLELDYALSEQSLDAGSEGRKQAQGWEEPAK